MKGFHILSGSAVVILAAIVGVFVSLRSWNGISYYYLDENKRHPAAVQRVFDFSQLEGSALKLALQRRLVSEARVVALEGERKLGIELGHFITRSANGGRQFACNTYDRVELFFIAKGVAIAGEKPLMIVKADCRIGKDINRISAIPIPVAKILKETPGDLELYYFEEGPVMIKFSHVIGQWPKEWLLYSVRLFHQDIVGREIKIDKDQIKKILVNGELKMTW